MRTRSKLVVLTALTALALGVAACGGDDSSAPSERPPSEPSPAGAESSGDPAAGEAIWTKAGCGGCHTLSAAGSTGTVGPRLDDLELDFVAAVERLAAGDDHPAFAEQLSEQEIADVVSYVISSSTG